MRVKVNMSNCPPETTRRTTAAVELTEKTPILKPQAELSLFIIPVNVTNASEVEGMVLG